MQRLRLVLFLTALLIALLGVAAFTESHIASAQPTQQSRAQLTSCSGNGCNGLDPAKTVCAAGAYIVQTAVFSNSYVQLLYSPRCGTNWGRVTSKVGPVVLVIRTQRIDGLTYTFSGGNFNFAWSAMVYAPRVAARACGGVNSISGCTAFV
jgi:hypothetical protein